MFHREIRLIEPAQEPYTRKRPPFSLLLLLLYIIILLLQWSLLRWSLPRSPSSSSSGRSWRRRPVLLSFWAGCYRCWLLLLPLKVGACFFLFNVCGRFLFGVCFLGCMRKLCSLLGKVGMKLRLVESLCLACIVAFFSVYDDAVLLFLLNVSSALMFMCELLLVSITKLFPLMLESLFFCCMHCIIC